MCESPQKTSACCQPHQEACVNYSQVKQPAPVFTEPSNAVTQIKESDMKLKLLGVMTATALLGTVLATTSAAQPRGRGGFDGAPPPRGEMRGPLRGGDRGGPPGGARAAQPERFIERHDTDADGRVSEAEFVDGRMQHIDALFERRDRNGDGQISLDEQDAPRARPARAGRGPRAGAVDRPARPEIDRDAVTACVRETIADFDPRFDDELEDLFERVDSNGDGMLSLAEVSAAIEARAHELFARIDDNGDGYITEDEVEAQFEAQLNVRRVTQACIKEQLGG
jgi:Ca2+-binding EF-hand superfamily protein